MSDFRKYLDKQLKDDEFKKYYDGLESRYKIIKQILRLRKKNYITQKELAKQVKTT